MLRQLNRAVWIDPHVSNDELLPDLENRDEQAWDAEVGRLRRHFRHVHNEHKSADWIFHAAVMKEPNASIRSCLSRNQGLVPDGLLHVVDHRLGNVQRRALGRTMAT